MAEGKTRNEILAELWSVTPEEAAQHEAARLAKRAASAAAVEPAEAEAAPEVEPETKKKDDAATDPA